MVRGKQPRLHQGPEKTAAATLKPLPFVSLGVDSWFAPSEAIALPLITTVHRLTDFRHLRLFSANFVDGRAEAQTTQELGSNPPISFHPCRSASIRG
jgi:hypothetical protein